jgi:hypothetical protein
MGHGTHKIILASYNHFGLLYTDKERLHKKSKQREVSLKNYHLHYTGDFILPS